MLLPSFFVVFELDSSLEKESTNDANRFVFVSVCSNMYTAMKQVDGICHYMSRAKWRETYGTMETFLKTTPATTIKTKTRHFLIETCMSNGGVDCPYVYALFVINDNNKQPSDELCGNLFFTYSDQFEEIKKLPIHPNMGTVVTKKLQVLS